MTNRLNIIAVERQSEPRSLPKLRREEAKVAFDKLWETNPQQFNPEKNALERERVKRTWNLIEHYFQSDQKQVADLGCGLGPFAIRLCEKGAFVDGVDISTIPIKLLQEKNIKNLKTWQDYVPRTIFKDNAYDLAIGTEIIAYLHNDEFRLFFSEMARIIKSDGYAVCSTPIDFRSYDSLERFANLAETEFQIEKWILSYHSLYIRLLDFLTAPSRFIRASKDKDYREKEIRKRFGLKKGWFKINSIFPLVLIWKVVNFIFKPLISLVEQNRSILIFLEKISRFFFSDSGISHAIFIGKRRPLVEVPPTDQQPVERKSKKQVWE